MPRCAVLGGLLALSAMGAHAVDFNVSGFGTVGYAVSDRSYHYQRFIDDKGTVRRDSVLGLQLDAVFNPTWSVTVQGKVAPSFNNDDDWSLTTSWAFVSWRPTNDWLVRLGKQRVPMFLNSENMDVGQTYEFARLPFETYGVSPTMDLSGLYVSRTLSPDLGELTVDLFAGEADLSARAWTRDMGALFLPVSTKIGGGVLTLKRDASTWRMGLYRAFTSMRDGSGLPASYPYVQAAPGVGYYRVREELPGPEPVGRVRNIINDLITVGVDVDLGDDWRLLTELCRNVQERTENGLNTAGGHVALMRRIGRATPYVSFARLRSVGEPVKVARALNDAAQSPAIEAADPRINAAQRAASDGILVYHQDTIAVGSSYALSAQSKLKLEWANTRIGDRSATVDSPAGPQPVSRQRIQVLSFNYSFVF